MKVISLLKKYILPILLMGIILFICFYKFEPDYPRRVMIINYDKLLEYGPSMCLCTSKPNVTFEYNETNNSWTPFINGHYDFSVTFYECSDGMRWLSFYNPSYENIIEVTVSLDGKNYSAPHVIKPERTYAFIVGECHHKDIQKDYSEMRLKWCREEECFEGKLDPRGWP